MTTQFLSKSPEQTESFAAELAGKLKKGQLIYLKGEMGAGKTHFVKAVVKALGSTDDTSSPTFALVNTYDFPAGTVHHFDLYRLSDIDELIEIGFEDYLDQDSLIFVEWPEIAEDEFKPDGIVNFEILADGERKISVDLQ